MIRGPYKYFLMRVGRGDQPITTKVYRPALFSVTWLCTVCLVLCTVCLVSFLDVKRVMYRLMNYLLCLFVTGIGHDNVLTPISSSLIARRIK